VCTARPPAKPAPRDFAATTLARAGCQPRQRPPLRHWRPNQPSTTRSAIRHVLDEHGPTARRELAPMVGARYWGPGVFSAALHEALAEGAVRRLSRTTFAAADKR
jgi:hypothetical protein